VEVKQGRQHILGMLDHDEVTAAYHQEVSRRMSPE